MSITRQSDKVTCKVSGARVVRLMDDYAVVLNIERAIRPKQDVAVCQDFMFINVVKTCREVSALSSALVSCILFSLLQIRPTYCTCFRRFFGGISTFPGNVTVPQSQDCDNFISDVIAPLLIVPPFPNTRNKKY